MKWILILAAAIFCLILVIYLIGLALPVKHSATLSETIPANISQTWHKITDPAQFPSWRKSLQQVELINDTEWIELAGRNKIPMKITEQAAEQKLVTVINSRHLPFGGQWVYQLQPKGDSTLLTITENGEVYNPVFKFASRFILGHSATMKSYLSDLKASFH